MTSLGMVLLVLAVLIVLTLTIYALSLLVKLKDQKKTIELQQQRAIEKRNANIFENVEALCMAGLQQQCDLSEIVIRVYCIMDYVQGADRVDFAQQYPAIFELYEVVKDMARGEEREKLDKQERMKQNLARHKAETSLHDEILLELAELKENIMSLNTQIPIKMM